MGALRRGLRFVSGLHTIGLAGACGAVLLTMGTRGCAAARALPAPVDVDCAALATGAPLPGWARVTGGELRLEEALVLLRRSTGDRISKAFVPVVPAGAEAPARYPIVLVTRDEALLALVRDLQRVRAQVQATESAARLVERDPGYGRWVRTHGARPDPAKARAQLDEFRRAHGATLRPARTVSGLALADDPDLRRSPLGASGRFEGARLLDHDAEPALVWPLVQLAAGVVLALIALAGIAGALTGRSTPDAQR